MSNAAPFSARHERIILILLTCVHFTHIMDYMIIMPLGARLMETLHIGPGDFSKLVAAYSLAAALSGLLGGFLLDRFERRSALIFLYAGFMLATLACAFAPNFHFLMAARFIAGGFGGVAGSVVFAIVSDVVPPERRGRGMGTVMSAFPLASIMGIPAGLYLTHLYDWPAPFILLGGLSLIVLLLILKLLPAIPGHPAAENPWRQMKIIVTHPVHQRGFALSTALVFAGGTVIPFMASSMVANHGFTEEKLTWIYLFGGAATLFTSQWVGRWADRADKVHVIGIISVVSASTAILITRLPDLALPWVVLATTGFFVGMASRFPPTMALITNAVDARYRGGFMSVNSAVQQASNSLASMVAGFFLTRGTHGELLGYSTVGLISAGAMLTTVLLSMRLKAIAPEAALPHGEKERKVVHAE